jgi:hypothetical protein
LISLVLKFSSEYAVLLLCRFAADLKRAVTFLSPVTARLWLVATPPKSTLMMRPFVVLFKHNALRTELCRSQICLHSSPVLSATNSQTFFVVCWAIVTVEVLDFFRCDNETSPLNTEPTGFC